MPTSLESVVTKYLRSGSPVIRRFKTSQVSALQNQPASIGIIVSTLTVGNSLF
jgi:hypothetical protein